MYKPTLQLQAQGHERWKSLGIEDVIIATSSRVQVVMLSLTENKVIYLAFVCILTPEVHVTRKCTWAHGRSTFSTYLGKYLVFLFMYTQHRIKTSSLPLKTMSVSFTRNDKKYHSS